MTEFRSDRERLLGVEERRACAERLEFRKDQHTGQYILEGYAATYEKYDVHGGPAAGGWVEQLRSDAFDQTLADQPDVQLLINHSEMPLARTKSGTLKLSRDRHGLRVWATLEPTDPDVQRLAPKMLRGDMDEMSFAFRVNDQSWDTSYSERTINALSLEKGDVSVVNYGMNPGTKAVLSVETLAQMSTKDLVELRNKHKLDGDQVKRAAAALATIADPKDAPSIGTVYVDVVPRLTDVMPRLTPRKDSPKEPYGSVTYADPGYKADGKKRYPIDNASHTKAAWSYINMPKNQKGYTSAQVASIKGRIKTAAKKFGIEISDGEKKMTDIRSQRALPPSDMQAPTRMPDKEKFTGTSITDWQPGNVESEDPHENPYDVGMLGDMPGSAPIPDNIMGDGGSFSGQHPSFNTPAAASDPHDISIDEEMLAMSMDPHDDPKDFGPSDTGGHLTPTHAEAGTPLSGGDPHNTPYDVGPQVGGVPMDHPNVGNFPQGKVADNIVLTGAALGGGSGCDPGTPPSVGTEPVDGDAKYDWTSGTISEPGDPPESLDSTLRGNDMGSYNPETGEGRADDCDDDADEDDKDKKADDDPIELKLDSLLAEALDKTIVHAYKAAEESAEARKLLVVARRQLNSLRGITPKSNTEISQKLAELRGLVGEPDAGTVTDGLHYLRSVGTAPVGYRGLLDHDPGLHMVTPSERLAREAVDKDRRAREAAQDADKAQERLKAARREAELNDAIRRLKLKAM